RVTVQRDADAAPRASLLFVYVTVKCSTSDAAPLFPPVCVVSKETDNGSRSAEKKVSDFRAMAEARVEEDEEGLRETREAAFRRTGFRPQDGSTDCTERHKPDRRSSSQGPLSSIRAAIKKTTRTNPLSDHPRDRRRPEITIVSAEPLPTSPWFPGNPAGFPPPTPSSQPIWGGSISVSSQ
ncbi:hypothetical protein Z043_106491, partial [Scleropages formosus]